jgi:hypothetical protein
MRLTHSSQIPIFRGDRFQQPHGLTPDAAGNLLVVDNTAFAELEMSPNDNVLAARTAP